MDEKNPASGGLFRNIAIKLKAAGAAATVAVAVLAIAAIAIWADGSNAMIGISFVLVIILNYLASGRK